MPKNYLLSVDRSGIKALYELESTARLLDRSKVGLSYDSEVGEWSICIKHGDDRTKKFTDPNVVVAIRQCLTYFVLKHKDRFRITEEDEKLLRQRLDFFIQMT